MRKKLNLVLWLLLALSYGFNLLAWGGLALERGVGEPVVAAVPTQAPVAMLYVYAGRVLVPVIGLGEFAAGRAESWFGNAYEDIRERPQTAVDSLFERASLMARTNYYLSLLLILAIAVRHALAPKPLRTFGGR
jgi:hypothetical protein